MNRAFSSVLAAVLVALPLSACSKGEQPKPTMDGAWVRTTEGAKDKTMTALFGAVNNPGDKPITLTGADCSSVAGMTQVHEMAEVDGKMVMREAKDGVTIKPGSHVHLAPGHNHVMLMQLKKELPVGDEVTCTLNFSGADSIEVKAMVKKATEEEDHYHEH